MSSTVAAARAASLKRDDDDDEAPPPPVDTPPKIISKKSNGSNTKAVAVNNAPFSNRGDGPSAVAPLPVADHVNHPSPTPIPGFDPLGTLSPHFLPNPTTTRRTKSNKQKEYVASMVHDLHEQNVSELSAHRQRLKQEKMNIRRRKVHVAAANNLSTTPQSSTQTQQSSFPVNYPTL